MNVRTSLHFSSTEFEKNKAMRLCSVWSFDVFNYESELFSLFAMVNVFMYKSDFLVLFLTQISWIRCFWYSTEIGDSGTIP